MDCYYRDERLTDDEVMPDEDVNCVQGITMVDAPKASIYTGGSRMDVENVKIMSWHIESNGIGAGEGSKIKNVFIKANDDSIVMGKSHMNVDNATVWRQRWGSVVNLSWNLKGHREKLDGTIVPLPDLENSKLNGLNVIRFDPGPTKETNGNASIVSVQNMMGGKIKDFKFNDIVVEEAPYEIINFQLDNENTFRRENRKIANQLDGTGNIENIKFDGLFTPAPYKVTNATEINPLGIQQSVFSIYDEQHYDERHHDENGQLCFYDKCGDKDCYDPADYKFSGRSISGVKLQNICIDNEGEIKGITASYPPPSWGVHIKDYFKFKAGVNSRLEHEEPYEGHPTGFNGIIGDGSRNTANICASLQKEPNMCTIENLRTYRKYCPASP